MTTASAWCVTIIAYLVLMIAFVSSKIVVGRRPHTQGMFIDLQTLAELEKERDRLEQQVRERQQQDPIDWKSVQNQVSNENALNEKLRDDRGTNAAALNDAAAEAERRMQANREAYEQGLAEERAIRERNGAGKDEERQDRKVKGRVTVSFSLTDPVRTSRSLNIPAYRARAGATWSSKSRSTVRVRWSTPVCRAAATSACANRPCVRHGFRASISTSRPLRASRGRLRTFLSRNKFFLPGRSGIFRGNC